MCNKSTLIVSPHFPPFKSGLSDYSYHFSKELKNYTSVRVVSGDPDKAWKGLPLLKFFYKLCFSSEEVLLIQYVPYMYGKRGMNLQFPFLIFLYSLFKRKKIHLMVHEFNYPFLGDTKSFFLNFYHQLMGRLLLISSDDVFCTTSFFKEYLSARTFTPVIHLPVGSNISHNNNPSGIIEKLSLENKEFVCLFGGFHSSKDLKFVHELLADKNITVVHIGVEDEELKTELGSDSPNVISTGYLKESEVSELLLKTKLLLTYFLDGATLRRGSLLAGIEHCTPTLTNKTENTEKELLDCPNIIFANGKTSFEECLLRALNSPRESFSFDNPFSWKSIVKKYISLRVG